MKWETEHCPQMTLIERRNNGRQKEGNLHFLQIANSDRPVAFYNLDVIISVGYRVKSNRGTEFRKWATRTLKSYLLHGYAVTQRIERFLLLDNTRLYTFGASFKDLGKKLFCFTLMENPAVVAAVRQLVE